MASAGISGVSATGAVADEAGVTGSPNLKVFYTTLTTTLPAGSTLTFTNTPPFDGAMSAFAARGVTKLAGVPAKTTGQTSAVSVSTSTPDSTPYFILAAVADFGPSSDPFTQDGNFTTPPNRIGTSAKPSANNITVGGGHTTANGSVTYTVDLGNNRAFSSLLAQFATAFAGVGQAGTVTVAIKETPNSLVATGTASNLGLKTDGAINSVFANSVAGNPSFTIALSVSVGAVGTQGFTGAALLELNMSVIAQGAAGGPLITEAVTVSGVFASGQRGALLASVSQLVLLIGVETQSTVGSMTPLLSLQNVAIEGVTAAGQTTVGGQQPFAAINGIAGSGETGILLDIDIVQPLIGIASPGMVGDLYLALYSTVAIRWMIVRATLARPEFKARIAVTVPDESYALTTLPAPIVMAALAAAGSRVISGHQLMIFHIPQTANLTYPASLTYGGHMLNNYAVNRTDFRLVRGVTNEIIFFVRDVDRKPVSLAGADSLTINIVDPKTDTLLMSRDLTVFDLAKGIYQLATLPAEMDTWPTGPVRWSMAYNRAASADTILMWTDLNYSPYSSLYVTDGPVPMVSPPVTIPFTEFTQLTDGLYYTRSLMAAAQVGYFNGVQTFVLRLADFTGTVRFEGSLITQPDPDANSADWFTVDSRDYEAFTSDEVINLVGNFLWMRVVVTLTSGTVTQLSYKA